MAQPNPEIRRLVAEAQGLPDGPTKVEVLHEAARVADAHNDVGLGFVLRKLIMSASLGGGLPEQMAVAFSWCLAHSDKYPEEIPPSDVLWEFRWVISELPHFPQVPRQQIEDTIQDMVRRYRAAGSTLRPVHLLRTFTYTKMGDRPAAAAALRDFEAAPRDALSDTPRQELNLVVNHLAFAGRWREAIDLSPKVMAGRVDEPGFFGQDSSELLIPLLELGQVADAVRVQRTGYRYLAKKPGLLAHIAFHVEFLARVDNFAGAVKVAEEHLPIAVETKQYVYRTHFLRSFLLLVDRLRRAGHAAHKFRLPAAVPVKAGRAGGHDLVALTEWLNADVTDWSDRFDARNGNRYFAEKLAALPDLAARPAPAV